MIVFTVNEHRNICIAGLNRQAGYATAYVIKIMHGYPNSKTSLLGSVTQFNMKMKDLQCSPEQSIVVQKADYGNFNNSIDMFGKNANIDRNCSQLSNCQVKSHCGGNRSCELTIDRNLLPSQYCSDISQEIYTQYTCVDVYSSDILTEGNELILRFRKYCSYKARHSKCLSFVWRLLTKSLQFFLDCLNNWAIRCQKNYIISHLVL